MEKLESVQYSAALAVKGTWRGTSRERLYNELGWESLSSRRWSRRLILFYKFINNLTPDYTREPIPPLHETSYPFRNQPAVGQIRARTEKFRSSFYPDCLFEWNKLDPEVRESPSVNILKKKLFSQIRPPANSVYGIHNPKEIAYLTQLRVGLNKLNFHKFKHFKDTESTQCVQLTMALKIRNTSCCFAILSQSIDTIFSLVSMTYSKPTDTLRLQKTTFCNFFYMEIKICPWKPTD